MMNVNWKGWDEALKSMQALRSDTQAKLLLASMYSAMKPVADQAKVNLLQRGNVQTGLLLKSVDRAKVMSSKDSFAAVRVGINSKVKGVNFKGKKRWPVKYAWIIHKDNPFILSAFENSADDLLNKTLNEFQKRIDKNTTKI